MPFSALAEVVNRVKQQLRSNQRTCGQAFNLTWRIAALGCALWTQACVATATFECETERGLVRCAPTAVCSPLGCVAAEAVDACNQLAEGAACIANAQSGRCHLSVCLAVICGDGIVAPPEACDDGNTTDGDGCSASCNSREFCGDAIVDPRFGEQCEESVGSASLTDSAVPGLAGDGCASHCLREAPQWRELTPGLQPLAGHILVSDPVRQRIVLFGGSERTRRSTETWEFDGYRWQRIATSYTPSPRNYAAATYDERLQRVVLFGGVTDTGYLNDTWTYDGLDWRTIDTPTKPPAQPAAMAYFPALQRIVMFSGANSSTWLFDGSDWQRLPTADGPSARRPLFQLLLDRARNRLILMGGNEGFGTPNTDMWEFTGTNWQILPLVHPVPVDYGELVYDEARQRLALLPGFSNQWWELTDDGWQQRVITDGSNAAAPNGRRAARLAFDYVSQQPILFGGLAARPEVGRYELSNETWRRGETWQQLTTYAPPPNRYAGLLTYDSHRNRIVVFGGYNEFGDARNTWEFDGFSWQQRTGPQPTASATANLQMVFAHHLQATILYDGEHRETWTYDHQGWQRLQPLQSPPRLADFAMAYDLAHKRVVIFGGVVDDEYLSRATYEFDGQTWVERSDVIASSPTWRMRHAMTYDSAQKRVVLFGGTVIVGDHLESENVVWDYDGTRWRLREITGEAPIARNFAAMQYLAPLGAVVLFGGYGPTRLGDTWLLRENTWQRLTLPTSPSARNAASITFDEVSNRLVLHGGWSESGHTNDTWTFSLSTIEAERDKCLDSTIDSDGDGKFGCGDATHPADPDCWGRCTPACDPRALPPAPATDAWPLGCASDNPHCGDRQCNPFLENRAICPVDCQ